VRPDTVERRAASCRRFAFNELQTQGKNPMRRPTQKDLMTALLRDEEPLDGEAARLITIDAHTLAEMLELLPPCFRRYAISNTEIDIIHEVEVCRGER
jgi:hypothetical protein